MKNQATNRQSATFTPSTTVADLMRDWPETIPVFLKFKMACVGCGMAAFERLADAVRIYDIPPDQFYDDLSEMISGK